MVTLPPDHARAVLLHAAGFDRDFPSGEAGIVAVLDALDWIQLDPIDRCGQNADLVVAARAEGTTRGDVHRVLRGRSFEHFAKERCIVHARHFAHYRDQAVETPWWRNSERMRKLPPSMLDEVLAEVAERGPMPAEALQARGRVEAMDWAGWKSTSRAEVLAAEALWTRCALVVSGRDSRGRRLYDLPSRAIPDHAAAPTPEAPFFEAMVVARVRSAGLLSRAGGAMWSMLATARTDGTVERLLAAGRLEEVRVGRRPYLALPETLAIDVPDTLAKAAERAVVLGPLDPLLWDRALVRDVFAFDYVWEIYKPESERQWGYYVCPVLADARLHSRMEARRERSVLRVERRWGDLPEPAWNAAIGRLAAMNAATSIDASRLIQD